MKILFILCYDFLSNSAIHVHGFSNVLAERGHQCFVAVPQKKQTAPEHFGPKIKYTPLEYAEIKNCFLANQIQPDIIHAWTPRERVRRQANICKKLFPKSRLIVHLEDNEEAILMRRTRLPMTILQKIPTKLLDLIVLGSLSHPIRYRSFLSEADGITVIMDRLLEFVPKEKSNMILWPIIDTEAFCSTDKDIHLMDKLGLEEDTIVLAYTGNVHAANANEVRELYMAVGLANQEGLPVKLIRTGLDLCRFIDKHNAWVKRYIIELGYISRKSIPAHLALADILIQPGESDIFNDYRLPSKIPEFLAMQKPVAIPRTNIGRFLKNNENALIMEKGDRYEILQIIKKLSADSDFPQKIAKGARNFAVHHFSGDVMGKKLEEFYYRFT